MNYCTNKRFHVLQYCMPGAHKLDISAASLGKRYRSVVSDFWNHEASRFLGTWLFKGWGVGFKIRSAASADQGHAGCHSIDMLSLRASLRG